MKLRSVEVSNFRNIAHLNLSPHEEFTFIRGDNGQGKTNLMESLYLLFTLRPLRTGNDLRPMVKKGEEFFSVKVCVERGEGEKELFLSFSKGQKRLLVNKVKVSPKEFLENGPLLFFSPDQATLIVESPEVRRRAMDRSIFNLESAYFDLLSRFKGALKRRNSILKMERDPALLASLDHSFMPLAFEVSQRRKRFITELAPYFARVWAALKPDIFPLTLDFVENLGGAASYEAFAGQVAAKRESDFMRGSSSLGPQREDIRFLVEGKSSKHFISHGERKVAALAFTLAFITMLREESDRAPILLIDDLAAELDDATRQRVLEFLNGLGIQILMTGISFPWKVKRPGSYLQIEQGAIQKTL